MGHAGHFASVPDGPVGQGDGSAAMALVFRAGRLVCALPLADVIETMRPLPTESLTGARAFVKGISIVRGVATPVIDVALLLGGETATVSRFVALRTTPGPVAFATGDVLGIRALGDAGATAAHAALLDGAPVHLVAGVGTFESAPLLVLHSMRVLAEEIWTAAHPVGAS